jgi:regulator of protease activity HflC (stomatin/prohibitin superfamily)
VPQTSLRSIIGKSDLDDLLSNRERLNQGLELMIDSPALGWGIAIDRVEIKDVALPETMKRSMSRQAEAERERRARVISADGELQASEKLAQAAAAMSRAPAALQLRLLETVVQVASEKNSTLVLPFPVELLRFLDAGTERVQAETASALGLRAAELAARLAAGGSAEQALPSADPTSLPAADQKATDARARPEPSEVSPRPAAEVNGQGSAEDVPSP